MRIVRWLAPVVVLVVPLQARADLITNGSFELGSPQPPSSGTPLPTGDTTMPGWTVIGGTAGDGLAWLPNTNPFGGTTPFGNNFLDLTGYFDQPNHFGVSQTIATDIGQAYTLTFHLGVDQADGRYSGPVGVTASAGATSQDFKDFNPALPGNQWGAFSLGFTATSTSTLISILGIQGNQYIGLDNVSVNAVGVPEPSAAALLGLGAGAGLLASARRRRARA